MAPEQLLSVGIDIGTSTTQLVISRLTLENRASPFSVPRIAIAQREVLYRSAIHFTPLLSHTVIDAAGVRNIVEEEYRASGFDKSAISTGAVIITGETARKENAREVLAALSEYAGDFVVATAGPDLESILAARGAGAEALSEREGSAVLHLDIGGGTSNLALFRAGEIAATGCFDVGGRLIKVEGGRITYLSPKVLEWKEYRGERTLEVGAEARPTLFSPLLADMVAALEQAAGLAPPDGLLDLFRTAGTAWTPPERVDALSFSGGVADCIWSPPSDPFAYGDMGVLLGQAIAASPVLNRLPLVRGAETIRATVVGAGSYSTQVSGSTIFHRSIPFPLKNLPILKLTVAEEALPPGALARAVEGKLRWFSDQEGMVPLALGLRGEESPSYERVRALAEGLSAGLAPLREAGFAPVVAVERDMAKVLGQALSLRLPGPLLCLDGVSVKSGDYIDIGAPVHQGAVLPVVIKTLAFEQERSI